jgi:hypothetical protein
MSRQNIFHYQGKGFCEELVLSYDVRLAPAAAPPSQSLYVRRGTTLVQSTVTPNPPGQTLQLLQPMLPTYPVHDR